MASCLLRTGKSILQNGWKTYEEQLKKSLKSGNSKAEKEETPLPQLSEGMTFEQVETKVSEHFTAPPKHFTEDICCERGIRNHP